MSVTSISSYAIAQIPKHTNGATSNHANRNLIYAIMSLRPQTMYPLTPPCVTPEQKDLLLIQAANHSFLRSLNICLFGNAS